MKCVRNSYKGALVVFVLLALAIGFANAQELFTDVNTTELPREVHRDSIIFRITGADSDTSRAFEPWKYTSFSFIAHGHADSTLFTAYAYAGTRYSSSVTRWAAVDSLDVTAPGFYIWQPSIPVIERCMVIFSSATTATGTVTIDSVRTNRNW
jgi:hypothetical protein